LNTEELGEREQTHTAVAAASYMAVYIRHTVPTSALLQEVVLVLSPTQPVRDAFIFVAGISRQPTQLDNWAGKSPRPPIDPLEDHVDHRNQVRSIATNRLVTVVDSTGQVTVISQPEEVSAGQLNSESGATGYIGGLFAEWICCKLLCPCLVDQVARRALPRTREEKANRQSAAWICCKILCPGICCAELCCKGLCGGKQKGKHAPPVFGLLGFTG
jgi:hypothetical protein